jgi:methyl-accepting chemotaxis protein
MLWTVRRKLMALAAFWGAMLIVVSGLGLMAVNEGRVSADRLSERQVATLHTLGDVRWYVALIRTAAILSTTSTGPAIQEQIALGDERRVKLLEVMAKLKDVPREPAQTVQVERLETALQEYLAVRTQVTALVRSGRQTDAFQMARTQASDKFKVIVSLADAMGAEARQEAAITRERIATTAQRTQTGLIALISVVLLLTAWITWRLTAAIDRQVQALRSAMRLVAEGDLCTSVEVTSRDELGGLAENFNWLVGELRGILQAVAGNADALKETAQQLSQAAGDAAMASRAVAGTVEQLANGSNTQADAVQKGAAETHRMSDAASDAVTGVDQVDVAASGAASAADQGRAHLEVAVQQVSELHQSVQGSAEAVSRLHDLSGQIGTIIAMIRGIANQTNLLALNAAIEAARAGDQGRGFAVVAEEVRKLAADSAGNAEQITRMITDTQNETRQALTMITRGMEEADRAMAQISDASQFFSQIHHAVGDTHHGVRGISVSIQQLSVSLQTVSASMESVAAVAEENAAASEQVSASVQEQSALVEQVSNSSDNLADLSADMHRLATRFRVSTQPMGSSTLAKPRQALAAG